MRMPTAFRTIVHNSLSGSPPTGTRCAGIFSYLKEKQAAIGTPWLLQFRFFSAKLVLHGAEAWPDRMNLVFARKNTTVALRPVSFGWARFILMMRSCRRALIIHFTG